MKQRKVPGGNERGGICVCGKPATPRSYWCLPCRISLRRWLRMSPTERKASYGRAEQRWCRVNTFSDKGNVVKFHPRRKAS